MNGWQRWVQAPGTTRFRRILFQVHLWLGIGLGVYILFISVSGSAVVLRPQINRWFLNNEVPSTDGNPLTGAALEARIAEVFSVYTVTNIVLPRREGRAVYVALARDGQESTRYFDQYTGTDLGPTFPWQVATVEWLTRLHDDLLLDRRTGRRINALGGLLLIVMVFSGLVLWWQGRRRWTEGLLLKRASSHTFLWQWHSVIGFWTFLLMLVWGITAIYFAFPEPFDSIVDAMDDTPDDFERPDGWLRFLVSMHFGRFRGYWAGLPYLWIVLGLLPAVMYITGFILWCKRVLKKAG
ncbi:MAG: PepSY-associated TM helix domain-containing protein [Pseudohongiellaceae bacterium]